MPCSASEVVEVIDCHLRDAGVDEPADLAAVLGARLAELGAPGAGSSFFADVVAFHRAFDVPAPEVCSGRLPADRLALRRRLLAEEFAELDEAMDAADAAEIAKEGADLVVVALGTMAEYGIPFDAVWCAVMRSNMAKLGADGRPLLRADGKVLKPPGWTRPDIAAVLAGSGRAV